MTADERRARRFLLAVSLIFLPIFAIPLLLHPYGWARRFGWRAEVAGYAAFAVLARSCRP